MSGPLKIMMAASSDSGGYVPPPQGLSLSVYPTSIQASASNGTYTTQNCTATPSGGTPPYSYSWASSQGITVLSPNSKSTKFKAGGFSDVVQGTATCTVTDSASGTAQAECEITIFFSNSGTELR